jgi:dTDP-glucose 4,6-dehydratase
MDNIVITGGCGFIGSHIVDLFVAKFPNSKITIFDKLTYAADVNNIYNHLLSNNIKLVVGDLANQSDCRKICKNTDLIIHTAAESHVDNSFYNSSLFSLSNAYGTHNLLDASKEAKVKKFIHLSTDEVYGENSKEGLPHTEKSHLQPTNPYAASKAGADLLVQTYIKAFNFPATIIRANNIYGIRQFPEKLIPRTILRLLSGMPALVHGNGEYQRAFLAAEDLSNAIFLLLNSEFNGEIFNVGSTSEFKNIDVVRIICKQLNLNFNDHVKFSEDRPFNDSRYFINYSKIQNVGWSQEKYIEDEWNLLIEWYSSNIFKYKDVPL